MAHLTSKGGERGDDSFRYFSLWAGGLGHFATDPGLRICDSPTPARGRVRTLESAPRRSSLCVSFFSLSLTPPLSFSLAFSLRTLNAPAIVGVVFRIPSQFVQHANFLSKKLTSSPCRTILPFLLILLVLLLLPLLLFLALVPRTRTSDLGSPALAETARGEKDVYTARARTRSSRVMLLEHTERKRARLAFARSCAELRKSRMLRYARASGRRVPFSLSLFLSLSLSPLLSLSLFLSLTLSFSFSLEGRDGKRRS